MDRSRKASIAVLLLLTASGCAFSSDSDWWDKKWDYRLPLDVRAAGYARHDRLAHVELNFTELLQRVGASGSFDPQSVRVVEVNAEGAVIDEDVAFQFDEGADFDASTRAEGTVVFILEGKTPAEATRHYQVYFGTTDGAFSTPRVQPQVSVTDSVWHEGQESIMVTTPRATYYYHKAGAGFASLFDKDGNDWISYRLGGGSAGEYRGIPNLVHPEGHFHPGSMTSTSTLLSRGPIRVQIYSETEDGDWATRWSIYPRYATMTLLEADSSYWFLYEGTPGGELNLEEDFIVHSTGKRMPVSEAWSEDLPAPEWLYFADGKLDRALFIAHHEDDDEPDQFWPMEGNMTVFGFGREYRCCGKYLTAVPAQFTIGLTNSRTFSEVSAFINATYRDVEIEAGSPEARVN